MFRVYSLTAAMVLMGLSFAGAATISEDFQSLTLGGTTPPAGWSLISVDGTSAYETTAGFSGAGLGGQISGNHSQNASTTPAGYVVNSGGVPFDLTKPISGSFNFYLPETGNYSHAHFMIGNIQTGISQTDAGEYLSMFLREQTFGARAAILDGDDNVLSTDSSYRINSDTWYTADFTWTPTSGTTGDFSYSVNYSTPWTATYTGFTFDNPEAFFGFGNGGYFGNTHAGIFDNISITGSEISDLRVPEPASIALWTVLGLGLAGFARYRRRRK